MSKRLTTEEFVERARKVHGSRYDYSLVKYMTIMSKIKIVCEKHGVFIQTANDHNSGNGCQKCGNISSNEGKKKNIEWLYFIASKNEGICMSTTYINIHSKYQWKCKNNHEFMMSAHDISGGHWCRHCSILKSSHNIEWLNNLAIKRDGVCLSNKYKSIADKYVFKCKNNHIWETTANIIQQGYWCPTCQESKGEREVVKILTNLNINFIRQHKFENCKHIKVLSFDFYLPTQNILIEFDGKQHFMNFIKLKRDLIRTSQRDQIKNKFCEDNNIKLIRIPYTELKNVEAILQNEYSRGFDRSLDLSQELHNKINFKVVINNEQQII